MKRLFRFLFGALLIVSLVGARSYGEDTSPDDVTYQNKSYPLYPELLTEKPQIPSPFTTADGREFVTCFTLDRKYFVVCVTVENGGPLDYRNNQWYGKGKQVGADSLDFPTLGRTGLHSDAELEKTATITGVPVEEITRIGRPERYSTAGFVGEDEDIVSILRGDNELVGRLGFIHPQLAKPLFHVFNMMIVVKKDSNRGNVGGMFYNGREVHLRFWGHKGWQESIFDDEILGYWEIEIRRNLDQDEKSFLSRRYANLAPEQMEDLITKLTYIHTGEMVPYYIVRYGFYEGHTSYRADPLAISCIFGLKDIGEIESAFRGRLDKALTGHFRIEKGPTDRR